MTLLEPLAALLVGMVLLWLVAQPMLFPARAGTEHFDIPDPEETPRGQALLALKEIEFDHATGKLSDADYALLNARYSTAAIATLESADRASTNPIRSAQGTGHCPVHGPCAEAEARFCPTCGLGLVTDAGGCVSCGFPVSPDSVFCAGCGIRLQA